MKYVAMTILLLAGTAVSARAQSLNENNSRDTTFIQPYDYIVLTNYGLNVAIINDGNVEIYRDKFGRKFNIYSELDIALQQLTLEGYEYVETVTFSDDDIRVLMRKKL